MTGGGRGRGGGLVNEGFWAAALGREEEALTLSLDLEEARIVGLGGGGCGCGWGCGCGGGLESRGGVAET